jgi:dUTPase
MKIKVEVLEGGTMPIKAHKSDSCYDVFAREIEHTPYCIIYKLGFKTKIPEGWEGELKSRSSISNYHLQQCNGIGVIDQGYTGEWQIRFNLSSPNLLYNFEKDEEDIKIYEVGDKVAQISFRKKDNYSLVPDLVTIETERGEGGFGSSGK